MRITRETAIPEEEIANFYQIYMEAFSELALKSALRQWMSESEFRAEMLNHSVTKIVGWDDTGQPAAILCVTNDPELVPWLNPEFYRLKFPEDFERQALYWVGTILVHPDRRGVNFVDELIRENTRFIFEVDGVCLFDCCHYNMQAVGLPELVAHFASEVVPVEYREIDTQHFYAMWRKREPHERAPLY